MSELKVNKISPATGTAFALGDSGDTFTLPSGATIVNSGTATGFGGGGVLQVKSTEKTSSFSTTSATLIAITGMSVTITPTLATSKILVISTCGGAGGVGTGYSQMQLLRDTTAIHIGDADGSRDRVTATLYSANSDGTMHPTIMVLDNPASTSAITYSLKGKCESTNKFFFNSFYSDPDNAIQGARSAASITAIEIAVGVL